MRINTKIKTKYQKLKDYLTGFNNKIRTYPKYIRIIYIFGFLVASSLAIPIIFFPFGLIFFILSIKIASDLYKDLKMQRYIKKR